MRDSKFIEAYLKIINEGADDAAPEMNDEQGGDEAAEQAAPLKKVTFLTSDEALVNALNSGFEEVVFFVKSENDEGEESVEEVKIGADSFGSVEVTDAEEETADDGDEVEGEDENIEGEDENVEGEDENVEGEDENVEGEDENVEGEDDIEEDDLEEGEDDIEEDDPTAECGEMEDQDVIEEDDPTAECGEMEDAQVDECGECGCDPSEWLEDGVCLKCGSADCDGTCEGSDAFQKMAAEEDGEDAGVEA